MVTSAAAAATTTTTTTVTTTVTLTRTMLTLSRTKTIADKDIVASQVRADDTVKTRQLDAVRTENQTYNSNSSMESEEEAIQSEAGATAMAVEEEKEKKEVNLERKCQENSTDFMEEQKLDSNTKSNNQENASCQLKEYPNYSGKTNILLKSKIDQVKRDLFSDEESDRNRTFSGNKLSNREYVHVADVATVVHTQLLDDEIEKVTRRKNTDSENPKNLSGVLLQWLQLVPTCKHDHVEDSQYRYMKCNRKTDLNETLPNSVEYHFLHDDNALSFKKRRRRYSNHELEFQINILSNDQNSDECVKAMTATDYEEIFNLPPKSRKRFGSRKSPSKHEIVCETLGKTNSTIVKGIYAKPLATSSPLDKPLVCKVKKISVKASTINEKNNDVMQYDNKKQLKVEKLQEIDKDNAAAKVSKRKASETKENKQIEKRLCSTDPQTLLSTLDLDKFLTSVHGPA
ncbi:hypothetical protein ANTQUA_LOCUS8 [Anthophora quadrimaculata]